MYGFTQLAPQEFVAQRPFTHPDHAVADHAVLRCMITELRRNLAMAAPGRSTSHFIPEESHWQRRLVYNRPDFPWQSLKLAIVGFFGSRRPVVSEESDAAIFDVGRELMALVAKFPQVIAYSTRLLACELNYANVVLLDCPESIDKWREQAQHLRAAVDLSPDYYQTVRIYRGELPAGGFMNPERLVLNSCKYWDFRSDPLWCAQRQIVME